MMTKLIKILPMLAIVAGIGGAFGFGAQQDPCEETGTIGFTTQIPVAEGQLPDPSDPARIPGVLGAGAGNYLCEAPTTPTCRHVYTEDPDNPGTMKWFECEGTLERN